jgi:hypothetical protein
LLDAAQSFPPDPTALCSTALASLNVNLPKRTFDRVVRFVDKDLNGQIDMQEFSTLILGKKFFDSHQLQHLQSVLTRSALSVHDHGHHDDKDDHRAGSGASSPNFSSAKGGSQCSEMKWAEDWAEHGGDAGQGQPSAQRLSISFASDGDEPGDSGPPV